MKTSIGKLSKKESMEVIKEAKWLASMVQSTMGLEGQGLDHSSLKDVQRRICLRLLFLEGDR